MYCFSKILFLIKDFWVY